MNSHHEGARPPFSTWGLFYFSCFSTRVAYGNCHSPLIQTLHEEGLGARLEVLSHRFCCELCQYSLLNTRLKIVCLESSYGYHWGKLETLIGLTRSTRKRAKGMVRGRRELWVDAGLCSRRRCFLRRKHNLPNVAARKSRTAWSL